jgi:ribosomal protein L7/L12
MATLLLIPMLIFLTHVLTISTMKTRFNRLERKLDRALRQLGALEPPPAELEAVYVQLRRGKKIQAIKAYRELTGADLKEAKAAVERMDS